MEITNQNLSILTQTNEHVAPEDKKVPNTKPPFFPPQAFKKVVAEIIATFYLVFVTAGSGALSANDGRKVSQLGASIAGGIIVTLMIYAVGHISGAHMNPAVTIAFAAFNHLPRRLAPVYIAAQLIGGIAAGFMLRVLFNPIQNLGTTSPSGSQLQSLLMEIVLTFNMMFIAMAVSTDTKSVQSGAFGGIAVGSAVCISSIFGGPISGGSMNPARSIGPAIASNYYNGIWIYLVGPLSGTLLGACAYSIVKLTDKPVQEISPRLSFKLPRLKSKNDEQVAAECSHNSP